MSLSAIGALRTSSAALDSVESTRLKAQHLPLRAYLLLNAPMFVYYVTQGFLDSKLTHWRACHSMRRRR